MIIIKILIIIKLNYYIRILFDLKFLIININETIKIDKIFIIKEI